MSSFIRPYCQFARISSNRGFLVERVWESTESAFGTCFVYVEDKNGARGYRPIAYNIRRSGIGLSALWGDSIRPATPSQPLFEVGKLRRPPIKADLHMFYIRQQVQ